MFQEQGSYLFVVVEAENVGVNTPKCDCPPGNLDFREEDLSAMAATTINTTALLSHNRVVSKKVVLVTGGATGLGRAVSLLFGKAG